MDILKDIVLLKAFFKFSLVLLTLNTISLIFTLVFNTDITIALISTLISALISGISYHIIRKNLKNK